MLQNMWWAGHIFSQGQPMCILCAFKVVCLKWRREVCWHYTHWFALCLSYQHTTYFLCRDFFSLPLLLFDETLSWWICWASENIRAVFVRNCSLGSYAMNKNISLGLLNVSIVRLLASYRSFWVRLLPFAPF